MPDLRITAALILTAAVSLIAGCIPWHGVVAEGEGQSVGMVSRGILLSGDHLPKRGAAFRSYKLLDRRFGSSRMVGLIGRATDRVAREYPGTVALVGDLSGRGGGNITEHHSHRSGRDVDFAFFVTDAHGGRVHGWPLERFDRYGVAVRAKGEVCRFDTALNWALVEGLLVDGSARVQWIFVSDGLKAHLLKWAIDHNRDVEMVSRAASVLHQPSDSAPHDDHFHVRTYCPPGEAGGLCVDVGPRWDWTREHADQARDAADDEALLALALGGLDR